MALKTNQPIVKDDNTYENYGVNLALSPMWRADGVGVSIAVRLTPYRTTDGEPERLDDEAKAIIYGDATQDALNDPDLAEFLRAIEAAGQAFINAKGL
jgi:hypothetical protein